MRVPQIRDPSLPAVDSLPESYKSKVSNYMQYTHAYDSIVDNNVLMFLHTRTCLYAM